MSTIMRIAASLVGISIAAIPVAALTVKNNAGQDITIGVDTGATEQVYKVPAKGSVDVKEDCSEGCGLTGPWGFSRMVTENDAIDTDGTSLVTTSTAAPAPAAPRLVPENPIEAVATDTPAAGPTPVATAKPAARKSSVEKPAPRRRSAAKKAAPQAKGPVPGSIGMLFFGPGKK